MHPNKNPQQSPWQRRRQQRRQQDDQLAAERKQALDASAPRLRNLFTFVQVFLLYVAVSVFGVDDRDLLDPSSTIPLPLPNIGLPTFYFFLLAPVLVALLHINLLLHHQAYQDKLRHWRDGAPKAQLDQLAPNFFDIAFLAQDRWQRQLVRASLWLLLYFCPPATLSLSLFWFADYQELWITLLHFGLLITSYSASLYFSSRQVTSSSRKRRFWPWARGLLLGVLPLVGTYLVAVVILLTWANYNFSNPLFTQIRNSWLINGLLYLPKIDAPSFVYKELDADTIKLAAAYENNITDAKLIQRYSRSIDLRGRSLRYADLSSSFLPKALLGAANLSGANLNGARLPNANLEKAHLQGAWLIYTHLQRADLKGAHLQDAVLKEARLQEVDLSEADLRGSDLSEARMQSSNLSKVRLQGAVLHSARLQDALLWMASLQGANLYKVRFQGANLWNVHLQGANLRDGYLQGANLRDAHLQGADLAYAFLQGADLEGARLQGADLEGARLQGANLLNVSLQGAYLEGAKLHGAQTHSNIIIYSESSGDRRKDLRRIQGLTSDLSQADNKVLSATDMEAIIAELEVVREFDGFADLRRPLINDSIHRIRAAVGEPWTLEGSGAITGVLTQEMIDEILEQWDD